MAERLMANVRKNASSGAFFCANPCVFQIFVVLLQRILTFESTILFLLVTFESKKQHNY